MYEIIYIPNFRKIVNKSIHVINTLKMSRTFISQNNYAKKLFQKWQKNFNAWRELIFFNFKWILLFFLIHMTFFVIFLGFD